MDGAAFWVIGNAIDLVFRMLHAIDILFCDMPKLLKYGPRYWRVRRQWLGRTQRRGRG